MTINKIEKPIHREIPIGWTTKKVSQVFDFLSTNSFSRNQMNYEEKEDSIYNIHYGDIHATYTEPILDLEKCKDVPVINEDVVIPTSASFLKDGDLVMADASEDYAGVGETVELIHLKNKKVLAGLHTFALRDKNGTTAIGFRTYIFKHPKVATSVKVIATGSKVYGISKTNLANVKVILPPFPEQQKIATILSTWDKAIDKLTQLIAAKEHRKKGLMQQLLTGKKRFAGFKDEWKEVKLGEIGKVKMCKRVFNHETKPEGDIPFYKISTFGKIADAYISSELYNEYKSKFSFPNKGDILISAAGTLGKTVVYDGKPAFFQDSNIVWIGHNENKVLNSFLFYVYQIIRYDSEGGTVKRLYNSIILNAKFKLPSIKEQQKIASVLSSADKEIELLKNELESLQQQKKGLMQVLLTGALRVPSV
ncbi:MAG TPA: restriction endonuclease subunit S [Brumimicrobium sp.]|nr:restriction endonuclease subunit S [Brumimicrobium sp.]